ncbi:hypothetical protein AB0H43_13580 [Hamadaea sp. NPDC050747]|uniref:hypothetical protein n=1 Tax=Hamadaea sp. NPDC050747 TaxID=3155789 RepID=UPI0033C7C341
MSVYLEVNNLDLLSKHPILVNLLSGTVGFCFGAVALSSVLASMIDGSKAATEIDHLQTDLTHLSYTIWVIVDHPSGFDDSVRQWHEDLTSVKQKVRELAEVEKLRGWKLTRGMEELQAVLDPWIEKLQGHGNRRSIRIAGDAFDRFSHDRSVANCLPMVAAIRDCLIDLSGGIANYRNVDRQLSAP